MTDCTEANAAAPLAAQKSMSGAPAYSRYVNRPLGRRLALLFVSVNFGPNAVTAVSACFTFTGLAMIALVPPSVPVALLITSLMLLGYACDSADGQVARMTGKGSPAGEWLDHIVDSAKMGSVHLLVLIHLYRFRDVEPAVLLLPLAFSAVSTVLFFGMLLINFLRRLNPGAVAGAQTSDAAWRSWVSIPSDYGLLCLVFLFLPWRDLFLTVYGVVLAGTVLFLAAAIVRWWRSFGVTGQGQA